jgi:hypothetical protein
MSNIQQLLESANPWKSIQDDATRLATKWGQTGLLEGLSDKIAKNNMAMMLENQAKQLVVEANVTGGTATFTAGSGDQWAGIALPLVRKIFGNIAAKEFVSVQPMSLPSGLVFYLDYTYANDKAPFVAGTSVYGNTSASGDPAGGLYGTGKFTYSTNNTSSILGFAVTTASWADFNFDAAYSASAAAGTYKKLTATFPALADYDAVRGFTISGSVGAGSGSGVLISDNLPAYTTTSVQGVAIPSATVSGSVSFLVSASCVSSLVATASLTASFQLQPIDNKRGDFEQGNTATNANNSTITIPKFNISLRSEAIVAKTKKLAATWTPEFAQDLNAYQNLDAEGELTNLMSDYISLEIDGELLDMLIENAPTVEYWSAISNQFINSTNTAFTQESATTGGGFYNTQGGWFQTLGTKVQKVSNAIHAKTLRGGANFMVCSPKVSTIIESIPGYASNNDGNVAKMEYAFGVQKAGQLNSRYTVYKNPYLQENIILMGFKGSQFLESGAVFSPYIPLIMTPLVYDPETFTPNKGLMTRYAKKMLRPEFYGKIYLAGLNTL